MIEGFLLYFMVLFLGAAIFRNEFVFILVYLLAGVFIVGRWWSHHSLLTLTYVRKFSQRVFLGEEVPVVVEVTQPGWLPLVWLRMQDGLPSGLGITGISQKVVTLGGKSSTKLEYCINATRRGYYKVGALRLSTGDPFGISGEFSVEGHPDYLIVYPRVVMLSNFGLPSRSPMGTLRHHLPIYEDPTRVLSKRDYVAGDSLRRVDWKASAMLGKLQVKQYEPSIALETMLCLNLNALEYELRSRTDATELGIVVAASIANWIVSHRQSVGFCANGLDPIGVTPDQSSQPIRTLPVGRGQNHLMRLLEILARSQAGSEEQKVTSFLNLVRYQRVHLAWGTTVVLITGSADERLFDEIFQARRSGLNATLILVGNVPGVQTAREKADFFSIPFHHVKSELDLDQWRLSKVSYKPNETFLTGQVQV